MEAEGRVTSTSGNTDGGFPAFITLQELSDLGIHHTLALAKVISTAVKKKVRYEQELYH